MINEDHYDQGYADGRADRDKELRELLEKDIALEKKGLKLAVAGVTTGADYNFRLGLIRKSEYWLAELDGEKK